MSRRGLIQAGVSGLVAFAIFIGLGMTVDLRSHGIELNHPVAQGDAPKVRPSEQPWERGDSLDKLRCFRCHNIERYRNGEDFSHEAHEDVGHCHVCHAFEGHFQAVIRRQVCEDCH